MKSLLSESDKRSFRDAIRLVTDTFMVTPVSYYLGGDSIDRWNEDRRDTKFRKVVLDALVEYSKSDKLKETLQGSVDATEVMLTFNLEYLQELELIAESEDSQLRVIFDADRDYFKLKDSVYEVIDVYYDGPLDSKEVLVIVKGKLYKDTIMLDNTSDY